MGFFTWPLLTEVLDGSTVTLGPLWSRVSLTLSSKPSESTECSKWQKGIKFRAFVSLARSFSWLLCLLLGYRTTLSEEWLAMTTILFDLFIRAYEWQKMINCATRLLYWIIFSVPNCLRSLHAIGFVSIISVRMLGLSSSSVLTCSILSNLKNNLLRIRRGRLHQIYFQHRKVTFTTPVRNRYLLPLIATVR